jgi:hypothetical protein
MPYMLIGIVVCCYHFSPYYDNFVPVVISIGRTRAKRPMAITLELNG